MIGGEHPIHVNLTLIGLDRILLSIKRGLQPKRNEINDKALLLMPATIPVDRQNQNNKEKTRRERLKSALYLRLKKRKKNFEKY